MCSLHQKKAAVSSQNSLISQSMPSFLIIAHNFFILKAMAEGEVHKDLILSKMTETFVVHVIFYLPEHGFRFYASSSPVFQSFLGAEQLFGSLLVFPEPVVQFYRPVPFCFKT